MKDKYGIENLFYSVDRNRWEIDVTLNGDLLCTVIGWNGDAGWEAGKKDAQAHARMIVEALTNGGSK